MDVLRSFISIDTFNSDAFLADALGLDLPGGQPQGVALPPSAEPVASSNAGPPTDEWTQNLIRSLQAQHGRVREFLQAQRQRWQQAAANYHRQIEKLEADIQSLQSICDCLRAELANRPADADVEAGQEAARRYLLALDDIRELKARNAELQKQLRDAQAMSPASGSSSGPLSSKSMAAAVATQGWEAEKRRILAALESDDGDDPDSKRRRLEIDEVVHRTDKLIAEKDREIEELQHLLASQSNSLGSLAVGAAALEAVFDEDAVIREERERLKQLQGECQEKLRQAEIEIAMERARLARREAELDERGRTADLRRSAADLDGESLAPTGRPLRGRWRSQLGLDDIPPDGDSRR